ncbi:hypothetical protein [Rhodovulum euryhalinum]|uniref:Uncharacterized protein n=1 Tax=Rhodovulum euryhalinum TaxID=35805 RepID=A0A4R2KNB8_9RHOB|nr:hypothetical protein [Rhodovulum euryhalinum]TCO71568.1 hypothetical protein EV655_10660 [Rhodovulum euryhalinum]
MNRTAIAATTVLFVMSTLPVHASEESDKAALAALAILGIAAFAHHEDHSREGHALQTGQDKADFERGYRYGLHNKPYDSAWSSAAYGSGYDPGHTERANRLAYKRHDAAQGAPNLAMRICVSEASAQWGRNPRDIHVAGSAMGTFSQAGGQEYRVEVATGHRHGVCNVNAEGTVFSTEDGRL